MQKRARLRIANSSFIADVFGRNKRRCFGLSLETTLCIYKKDRCKGRTNVESRYSQLRIWTAFRRPMGKFLSPDKKIPVEKYRSWPMIHENYSLLFAEYLNLVRLFNLRVWSSFSGFPRL